MMTPSHRKQRRHVANKTLEILTQRFPACFVSPKKPLKIGIDHDIKSEMPELNSYKITAALFYYTNGPTYLDQMVAGAERVDLAGNPVGVITEAEAVRAARLSVGVVAVRRLEDDFKKTMRMLREITETAAGHVANGHDQTDALKECVERSRSTIAAILHTENGGSSIKGEKL